MEAIKGLFTSTTAGAMNSLGKVYPRPTIITPEFAKFLAERGAAIERIEKHLGRKKWAFAGDVNLEWRDGDYEIEKVNKREYYSECAKYLPVMIFGKSGETLRRWCEVEAHYKDVDEALLLLEGSSFDHLLRAKRLEANNKEIAVVAVSTAIKDGLNAEEMQYNFDPSSSGESENRTIDRLFSLADAMWIPREAAALILQAVIIIRDARKVKS